MSSLSFYKSHEFVIFCALALYSALVAIVNPQAFLTYANVFDILRNSALYGILALGVLMVMLTGGVDLSFPAVGAFSSYICILFFKHFHLNSLIGIYATALTIGIVIGSINGYLVSKIKATAMIVTLGTSSILYSSLLFIFGSTVIFSIPSGLRKFSNSSLITIDDVTVGISSLHPVVLIWFALAMIVYALLTRTMFGRYLYALGGNEEVCRRSGVNIQRVNIIMFAIVGALAAVAAVSYSSMFRMSSPITFMSQELDVIAAVVLGGTSITGGKGSVLGTILGVLLITVMQNSLILLGIPSQWQKLLVGMLLLIGVSGPVILPKLKNKLTIKGAINA